MSDITVAESEPDEDADSYVIGTTSDGEYVSVNNGIYTKLEEIADGTDRSLMDALTILKRRVQVNRVVDSVLDTISEWGDYPPYQDVVNCTEALSKIVSETDSGALNPDDDPQLETYLAEVQELETNLRILQQQYETMMGGVDDESVEDGEMPKVSVPDAEGLEDDEA